MTDRAQGQRELAIDEMPDEDYETLLATILQEFPGEEEAIELMLYDTYWH